MQNFWSKKTNTQSYQNKRARKINLTIAKTRKSIAISIIVKIKKENKEIKQFNQILDNRRTLSIVKRKRQFDQELSTNINISLSIKQITSIYSTLIYICYNLKIKQQKYKTYSKVYQFFIY